MVHYLAHSNGKYHRDCDASYIYDMHNRLEQVKDSEIPNMDEMFAYDAQGRIVHQARGEGLDKLPGARHNYIAHSNRLLTVTSGSGADLDGNLIADHSKKLTIAYDWRGMPTEFLMETIAKNELNPAGDSSRDSVRVLMAYDGSGRRVSKTRERKTETGDWVRESVTHYTGIGTEVRENYSEGSFLDARVVVNMPHGLGRYGIENATAQNVASDFEWYLKNHLGSTMLVYATGVSTDGSIKAAYDYRAFGEQVDLAVPAEKVTENFTGKERDDETALNYFGARYLDPMIGLWISVDPKRQFASPYLYVGNGYNPVNGVDPDGNTVSGTFKKSTGLLTLKDDKTGKSVSGKYFSGGKPYGDPIPNGQYEILAQSRKPGFYRLDMKDVNLRNDVAELSDGSTRDRLRLHGAGRSIGCITAYDGTNHSEIDDLLQNTETTTVKDNYDAPWYIDVKNFIKNFFSDSDSDTEITKYGELDVTD